MRIVIDFGKDTLINYVVSSIHSPILSTVVNSKEVIILTILKTLPLSPKIILLIALFL